MIVYLNGRFLPRERGAHLAARSRLSLRRRDLRGRALPPRTPVSPGGASRAHARGARRAPDRGDAGFLSRRRARVCSRRTGCSTADAIVYAQVSRGAAPRDARLSAAGTPPTVFAFARESDPPPAAEGGRADPRARRAVGTLRHQDRDAPAERARRAAGAGGRRDRRDPRPRRRRARRHEGEPLRRSRRARCARRRTVRAILPGVTRGATIAAARAARISGRGARLHRRGDARGRRGLPRLDDALDLSARRGRRDAGSGAGAGPATRMSASAARGVPRRKPSPYRRPPARAHARVARFDDRGDAAARGERAGDRHRLRAAGRHAVVEDPIDGVLVEDADVAVRHDVELERLQLQTQPVRARSGSSGARSRADRSSDRSRCTRGSRP